MAVLFKVEGKVVFPHTETLLISPFKEIWGRDKNKSKIKALKEFTYMEFISSMRKTNPYRQYPEGKKHEILIEDIIKDYKWEPDTLIKEGIQKIIEFQTEGSTTYSYYMAAKKAAENMKDFFESVDINERDEKGKPIYTPKAITSALLDTEKILGGLKSMEKKVEEELYENTKTMGGKNISPFAIPGNKRT